MLPLALLTDEAEPRLNEIVDRVVKRLDADRVREATRKRVLTSGYFLLGMRYNDERIEQGFLKVQGMREYSPYQAVLREGQLTSKQEDLLDFLRGRFALLPESLEQRILATTDLATLRTAIRTATTATSLDACWLALGGKPE